MDTNNNNQRVVITGMGVVTPLGHNLADTWDAILAGRSGIGPFTQLDPSLHVTPCLFEVKDFEPHDYLDRREARRRDRYQQFATIAANEAMAQSGLVLTDENRDRAGIFMGTGIGGVRTLVQQEHVLYEKGSRRVSPFAITMIMPNGAAGMMAIDHGVYGPSTTITTACAAGCDAVGHAFHAIRRGDLVAALAGGSESILASVAVAGFEQAQATTKRDGQTPRPFDKDRDGLAVGEGAGVVVMESLAHAQARGANILGEIIGYGQTTDAYHITAPAEGGSGAARAIVKALRDAEITAEDVDYISAHGTATKLNDVAETAAIKQALGPHARKVAISSTKSMTGHIMGATGAIETIFCMQAMQAQIIPATINYETPDPECDLDYVPNEARPANIDVCLNHAFGFGGHNAVLVLKRYMA